MVWYFVLKKYFTRSLRPLMKYFSTLEEKFRISKRPCNILYLALFNTILNFTSVLVNKIQYILNILPWDWCAVKTAIFVQIT